MPGKPDYFQSNDYIKTLERTRAFEPSVTPLTEGNILKVLGTVVSEGDYDALSELYTQNIHIYQQSTTIGVYLNARVGFQSQGWIGDMIEAARLIPALIEDGKRVVLMTSHPELFADYSPGKLTKHCIPADLDSIPHYPWSPDIIKFVHSKTHSYPTMFPMNAAMPALFFTQANGAFSNDDIAKLVKSAIHPNRQKNPGILPKDWAKACHQLHALQISAYLMGMKSAVKWDQFPKPPIEPSHSAMLVAQNAIRATGLTDSQPVLMVHPGTATNNHKVQSKYYPLNCWQAALSELIPDLIRLNYHTLIVSPNDFQQAVDCANMMAFLKTKGLANTSLFPPPERFGNQTLSLEAFVSVIDQLKDRMIMMGLDSMPAGHLAPAFDIPSIVVGNWIYLPNFYCPPSKALVVLPPYGCTNASDVSSHNVAQAARVFINK